MDGYILLHNISFNVFFSLPQFAPIGLLPNIIKSQWALLKYKHEEYFVSVGVDFQLCASWLSYLGTILFKIFLMENFFDAAWC